MKTGDEFATDNWRLLEPLQGTIIVAEVDGKQITARIMTVGEKTTILKVVPKDTRN